MSSNLSVSVSSTPCDSDKALNLQLTQISKRVLVPCHTLQSPQNILILIWLIKFKLLVVDKDSWYNKMMTGDLVLVIISLIYNGDKRL